MGLALDGGGRRHIDSERVYSDRVRRAACDSDRISFTGFKTAADIAALLGQSDVFINLSATEVWIKRSSRRWRPGVSSSAATMPFAGWLARRAFRNAPSSARRSSARQAVGDCSNAFGVRCAIANRQLQVARNHTLDGLIGRLCEILEREAARAG